MGEEEGYSKENQADYHTSKTGKDELSPSQLLHTVHADESKDEIAKCNDGTKTNSFVVVHYPGHFKNSGSVVPERR